MKNILLGIGSFSLRIITPLGVAALFLAFAEAFADAPPLSPDEATPTTNTDVSSFISTAGGYDAWTGSARRIIHDIYPVAGSVAAGGLKLDRTYSSHNDSQRQPDYYDAPGEQYSAAPVSYTWWMTGLTGLNDGSADLYVVHFPDGRSAGFHRPEDSAIEGETEAWRSALGTKERLVIDNPNGNGYPGTADLYLEDGSVVHFNRTTEFVERESPPPGDPRPANFLFDIFTPTGISDPHGLLTTFAMEQIPGTFDTWQTRLKRVTDPSGQYLEFSYYSDQQFSPISQVTASDGQWVSYDPYPNVTYSDGTSATYEVSSVQPIDPDSGAPGTPTLVWLSAQDTRAEGPMRSIQYTYRDEPPPKFAGQIVSEKHYGDGIPVSTFTSDDARTLGTDQRGDGPSRTFYMEKSGQTPLLQWKTDFYGANEFFYYDGDKYLNKYTDRRGADTVYANEPILGRPTTVTYRDFSDNVVGMHSGLSILLQGRRQRCSSPLLHLFR